jgi:hypothetical protein
MTISTKHAAQIRKGVVVAKRHIKAVWDMQSFPTRQNLQEFESNLQEISNLGSHLTYKTYARLVDAETARTKAKNDVLIAEIAHSQQKQGQMLDSLIADFDLPADRSKPVLRSGFHD